MSDKGRKLQGEWENPTIPVPSSPIAADCRRFSPLVGASSQLTKAIPALLVPEDRLKRLVTAARTAVFDIDELGELATVQSRAAWRELDGASEWFADDQGGLVTEKDVELVGSAEIVRTWLQAGCITVPPVHHITALVESIL